MKQAKIEWQHGQPVNQQFEDIYFSRQGGIAETEHVFLKHNGLPERWLDCEQFVIAETGFGTGLNFLITLRHWLDSAPLHARLYYFSVEKYPLSRTDLLQALSVWDDYQDLVDQLLAVYPPAVNGFHPMRFCQQRVTLVLMLGDVETLLSQMNASVDAWYLDGFAPGKNPDMWSKQVFQQIAAHSHPDTRFSTYTAVGDVRRGLRDCGFDVSRVAGFGEKREMLTGVMTAPQRPKTTMPWFYPPHEKSKAKRVAVVGAGIAGVMTAWSLANRGWQVMLIEKHASLAQEGSGNPLGVLMPRITLDQSVEGEFYASAFFVMVNLLNQIKRADDSFSWQQQGVLQLASSERIKKQIQKIDLPDDYVCAVSAQQASDICGLDIATEALYFKQAGWFRPEDLCQRLLAMQVGNIQLHSHTEVTRLSHDQSDWQIMCADHKVFNVDAVVLATASQVSDFQQTEFLELQTARGQISYLPSVQQSRKLKCAVCYDGYILPSTDEQHVVGATFEPDISSLEMSLDGHVKNLESCNQWMNNLFPNIDITAVQGRTGLRATTTDRMPIVGAVPDLEFYQAEYHDLYKGRAENVYPEARYLPGLYVNVGHGARGLTSSLLCAEIIAAELNAEPVCVSNNVQYALHPARSVIKKYKKGK
ncbi:MAG: bifunctional tRNA (5-methylaminomethyl-2-thiouridine)(34)-methyltransferase MnmD/FAD-dependent 5-carboxymethylaminomethyl-2-thiouridine(34) oxidoreductase MnmC [Gammaproteobacteria bacterium]|nr:bifunctional tRNA (5-methylaminomethyl-2-thiouridine)(34)-methyltransferase MnmD/FAD-dependent 5-carboxymethylaminomethyl-2-thiouridine(34) oxidoreductase MnmC [Gammaproteobacteria bacterium]